MGLKIRPITLGPRRILMRGTGVNRRIVIRPATSGSSGGVSDHGALTGLSDDDHTQYAKADGTRGNFASAAQGALADTALQSLDVEAVQDLVAAFVVAGTGITLAYDDALGTLTFSIGALGVTDTFTVLDQAAMLALTAQKGDVAVRSDLPGTFILAAEPASTLGNWVQLPTPTDSVLSVNGQTGVVTITAAGLGAVPTSRTVNGHPLTNNVTIAVGDISGLQGQIDAKAPSTSPTFTGTPEAPTAPQGTDTAQVATTAYVQTEAGLMVPKSTVDAKGDLIVGTADNTVTRLAVGPMNRQPLVVDSAAASGVKWGVGTEASAAQYRSGQYVPAAVEFVGVSALSLIADYIVAIPCYIPPGLPIDRLASYCTTPGVGATIRLGLHRVRSDGYVGTQIVSHAGTLSNGSTGLKEATVSAVGEGWCWFVFQSGGAAASARTFTAPTFLSSRMGAPMYDIAASSPSLMTNLQAVRADAALPSDLSTGVTWVPNNNTNLNIGMYRAA